MSKYIIKNCPCYVQYENSLHLCCDGQGDGECQDCTDCAMKQIVELCKDDLKPVREWQEGDAVFVEYKNDAYLAKNILQLFEIEECE